MISNPKTLLKIARMMNNTGKYSFASKGGNLYTWGLYSSGTGFVAPNTCPKLATPRRIAELDGQVAKVATGYYHSAVITTNGDLYTYGTGKYGALGLDISWNSEYTPTKVEFFATQGLQVKNVWCGRHLTIAQTENGDFYSWGFGGTYDNRIIDRFFPRYGALGYGDSLHRFAPAPIEKLGGQGVTQLTVGDDFATAVTQKGEVLNWGNGEDGAFASGSDNGLLSPQPNGNLEYLRHHDKQSISKIRSAAHATVALFSDGKLYGWGRNDSGQLGVRHNLGHRDDGVIYLPTPVCWDNLGSSQVVDFDLGENTLLILTDKNEVFWAGLELAYKPVRFEIPSGEQVTQLIPSKDSFAVLTDKNQLYSFNDFISPASRKVGQHYAVTDAANTFKGKVLDIGGTYGTRFAIVQN